MQRAKGIAALAADGIGMVLTRLCVYQHLRVNSRSKPCQFTWVLPHSVQRIPANLGSSDEIYQIRSVGEIDVFAP